MTGISNETRAKRNTQILIDCKYGNGLFHSMAERDQGHFVDGEGSEVVGCVLGGQFNMYGFHKLVAVCVNLGK